MRIDNMPLRDWLEARMNALEAEYGFDEDNGYSQVMGRGEEANRAYGAYDMIRDLLLSLPPRR